MHNDSTNGRLGYVFSLTRNDRKTIGGETMLVHERDLFRSRLDQPSAGVDLFDLVEPRFNRLTLFDDRVPHAVHRLEGPMDPLEGRFVLHGHISEAGIIAEGPLDSETIAKQVTPIFETLRGHAGEDVHGPFVVELRIAEDGSVQAAQPLLDRFASRTSSNLDPLRAAIIAELQAIRFPESSAATRANVPLKF